MLVIASCLIQSARVVCNIGVLVFASHSMSLATCVLSAVGLVMPQEYIMSFGAGLDLGVEGCTTRCFAKVMTVWWSFVMV